jgi:murein DD-endopeptidase MepM/ murein hydrolase activator NlpD
MTRVVAVLLALASAACTTTSRADEVRAEKLRRREAALLAADGSDAVSWNRLGEDAAGAEDDVARRAFARAESLVWPDPRPRNAVPLSLPFEGRWRVTQGNRGVYSHARLADRFAWDFQRVDARGATNPSGDDSPAAFFGFGAPVFAPADGVVVVAEDGVPDNLDGGRDQVHAGGNKIVLRHGSGECSHLCHLRNGSVLVRVGQIVRRGEMIGRCGCSGNAAEPHLHYVLRLGPSTEDWSVPARFEDGGVPEDDDVVVAAPRG